MHIVIISGSPRTASLTRRIARHLKLKLDSQSVSSELIDLSVWNVPPIQSVWSTPDAAPEPFQALAKQIEAADAYLLVSPEYNGSYSPALKNLLDHFPKRNRKPFGLATGSPGALGGIRAAQQLLLLVPALFGISAPQFLLVPAVDKKLDESGQLLDEAFQKNVDQFLYEFLWLCERIVDPPNTK